MDPRHADLSAYTRQQRRIEVAAIAAFGVFGGWSVWRVAMACEAGMLALAALAGWIAADFFSGLVHWAFDTWGSVRTPFLGPRFIRPFREHHYDPRAMAGHDFVETNGASCVAGLPVVVATATMPVHSPAWVAGQALLLFTALGVLMTNQFHKWAHQEAAEVPVAARLAQRMRLVLHPGHHRRHHTAPFDSHYCTTTGWLNAPLERIALFRRIEDLIRRRGSVN